MSTIATVKDFGAVGDGEANDTGAIKDAISTVGGMGPGAELFFPLGRYKIRETLRVQTPLLLRGSGFGDVTGSESGIIQNANTALVWDDDVSPGTMVHFIGPNPGDTIHGGGIRGLLLDANNVATRCVHVSTARETELDIATFRPTGEAILLDNANGRLLDSVRIPRLVARVGNKEAASNAHGIRIQGTVNDEENLLGCTNVFMGDIDVEYNRGDGIVFEGVDSCIVVKLKGAERGDGTGRAAFFRNGTSGFPAQKNVIVHLARGKVLVENQCIGNRVLYWNSEAGGTFLQGGQSNFSYAVTDRVHGDTFQGGTIYPMRENLSILPGALQKGGGAADAAIGPGGWGAVALPAAGESEVRFSVPAPGSFNNGRIRGVRISSFPSVGAAQNDVRLNLRMLAIREGQGTNVAERSMTEMVQLSPNNGVLKLIDVVFKRQDGRERPLNYSRGEWITGTLRREADDATDTSPQGFLIGGLQVLYECNGPDGGAAGSSGPWQVPRDQLD